MRFAILANNYPGHVKPQAEGLHRMFTRIGVESRIFYNGLRMLTFDNPFYHDNSSINFRLKKLIKNFMVYPYLTRLTSFDAIIITLNVPTSMMKHFKVELLRKMFPQKPIINYDLHYLPTMWKWPEILRNGDPTRGIPEGGHYGLERYDWYLMATVTTHDPLVAGIHHPYSLIGLDLEDGALYPEQDKFTALLDFERPTHMKERAVQIQALEETNTPYIVLNGRYSIDEIRKIYRQTSIYFLASPESFGLPICELQLCGSYVFTAYERFCQAHQEKKDATLPGSGELSSNFIVYNNDKQTLKNLIKAVKNNYDPQNVINTFKNHQSHFYHGDPEALRKFVELIAKREITSSSHKAYENFPIARYLS
jgi:hypothetical protein